MTQTTIVVDDKIVLVGGVACHLPDLDISSFRNIGAQHDDIRAVQFDTASGQGHVEYCEVITNEATRPNIKPGNWLIDQATFERKFGWVLPLHEKQVAANAAKEAEDLKAALEIQANMPMIGSQATSDDALQKAMMAELMALKEANESLKRQVETHTATFQALGEIDLAKPQ